MVMALPCVVLFLSCSGTTCRASRQERSVAETQSLPCARSCCAAGPDVRLDGGFWGERQQLNRPSSSRTATPGSRGSAGSTTSAIRTASAGRRVRRLGRLQDGRGDGVGRVVRRRARSRTSRAKMAAAQEDDGYLNTRFGHRGREHRYTDLEWGHELYCYGHMIQAAVARLRTHGSDQFVADRAARRRPRVRRVRPDGNQGVCGHPGDRDGAGRALPRHRARSATSSRRGCSSTAAARRRWPTSSAAAPTSRTTCRSVRPRRSAATPCARCTSPAARSTSRSRPATRELLQTIIAPVGAHDRAPHVPDRRHGLPPHRRVLRRGLRAAARPRVLGDLRRRRLGPARLAPAARHRRRRATPT